MAMVDYGAIVWKDGKLISTDMFTPMEDMVGWSDVDESKSVGSNLTLADNYFGYIGDKDFTIGFYKNVMRIYSAVDENYNEIIYFGSEPFKKWSYWKKWYFFTSVDDDAEVIVRPRKFHDYYICEMDYRGHHYKVAFGYGVDLKYYKKTHIIDYYGTPWFRIGSLCRDMKYRFEEWKWSKGL